MLLGPLLLRGLEVEPELLEARAREVEDDAQEHLLNRGAGVGAGVRLRVRVRVGVRLRVRVRVGVRLRVGVKSAGFGVRVLGLGRLRAGTDTTRSVEVEKMASMKNLRTQEKPHEERLVARLPAAEARPSRPEIAEMLAEEKETSLPVMSSSLSAS